MIKNHRYALVSALLHFRLSRFSYVFMISALVMAQAAGCHGSTTVGDQSAAPSIRFVGLRHYTRVTNQVSIPVQANDDVGVSRIELYLDGALIGTNNVVPNLPSVLVSFGWNTLQASNGKHVLQAKAYDADGNFQIAALIMLSHNFSVPTPTPSGNIVNVLPAINYQTMKGWQASGDTGYIEFINSFTNWNNAALDANVDMGINVVRIGLHSGIAENSTDYYGNFLANRQDATVGNGVALWQAVRNNWRIPVNDNGDPNSINASGFKWSMVDWQIDNAVVPLKAKLAARGETLFWTVTYIHFSTSNQLHVDTPAEYGELILATWNHINSRYGYVPDALEIFLEPDNNAAQVTEAELAAMVTAARNRLVNAGYAKPYFVAPSIVNGSQINNWYDTLKASHATAFGYIDEIGYHRYGQPSTADLTTLRTKADADGKNTGMTEFGSANHLDLYNDLVYGKVSTWEEYALAFPNLDDDGYQYFLIGSSPGYTLTIGSRARLIQQYTRYIRRGAVMKGVTNSNANFSGVPFRNTNGSYVVPIKCTASGTITVAGLPAGTYGIRYTTASNYNVALPNQVITSGGFITFNMPAAGVATVYDINYMNAAPGSSGQQ